jgi:hypothetical protein
VLKEPEKVQVLIDILNSENTGKFGKDDDGIFGCDYM